MRNTVRNRAFSAALLITTAGLGAGSAHSLPVPMGAVRTVDVSVSAAEQGTQVAFDSESKTEPPDTGRARAVVERFGPFGQAFGFSSGAVSTADFVLGSFAGSNDVLTALSTVPTGVSRAYQHNTPDLEVRSELDYSASFDASITANHRFNFLLRGMRLTINSSSAEYDLTNPYTATLGAEIRVLTAPILNTLFDEAR